MAEINKIFPDYKTKSNIIDAEVLNQMNILKLKNYGILRNI